MISKKMIQTAIDLSVETNSAETTMTFCQMRNFNEWCLKVTVQKHECCERDETEEAQLVERGKE